MKKRLNKVLTSIGKAFEGQIQKGARHYLEINIGQYAGKLGYTDIMEKHLKTYAIVPLKSPREGMKVRIDGRTFVNYAEDETGIAFPGYLAMEAGRSFKTFIPNDSMICNFN